MMIDRTSDVAMADRDIPGERVLVAAAAAGDREAFGELVLLHERVVVRTALAALGRQADAEDVAQDAFVRAWRGLKNFKGQSALATWLYRIAVNVCLNKVGAKTPVTEPIESTERFADTRIEGAPHAMIREQRAAAVRKAIAGLPKKQRATLILRTYHDLSHQQIADVLGSSVGAVKANFFHALANLKKILGSEP